MTLSMKFIQHCYTLDNNKYEKIAGLYSKYKHKEKKARSK